MVDLRILWNVIHEGKASRTLIGLGVGIEKVLKNECKETSVTEIT
jgi:hypothetical protein